MGCMLDSDWSSQNLLRSDWLGPEGATITTVVDKTLTHTSWTYPKMDYTAEV